MSTLCEHHLDGCKLGKISDEDLFKQPPHIEGDCPICFLRLPIIPTGYKYKTCCGKMICSGCSYAPLYDNQGNKVDNKKCQFCRVPTPFTNEEIVNRVEKRAEADDAEAIPNLGMYYFSGLYGVRQDDTKAFQLFHQAAQLGYAEAYCGIGFSYYLGRGVEQDEKKANYYWELAAIRGDSIARRNLGIAEVTVGNYERAVKHFMIAVRDGHADSLEQIKNMYSNGHATKEVNTTALQSYQAYLGEIKSRQRDQAAAFDSKLYRYY